jgi:hypothetical protein
MPVGSDFGTGDLTGAYFDMDANGVSGAVQVTLVKQAYTGSSFFDVGWITSNGTHDKWVPAVNVLTNPSVYDYVGAQADETLGADIRSFFGAALTSSK